LKSRIFEAIQSSKDKGENLMRGFKSNISAIAVHPKKSILAIAGANGFIIFWDYIKKGDIDGNQFELLTSEPKSGD
jgi:WD40 repeat protein